VTTTPLASRPATSAPAAPQGPPSRRPSVTAEITCAQRALETMAPDGERLLHDPYARLFVRSPAFRLRMATPALARLTRRVFERRYPGYMAVVLLRARWCDDLLAEARADGIRQVVLIGAGYDTTALRAVPGDLIVYELDTPATQERKRALLARAGIEPATPTVYAPCDLEAEQLGDVLDRHGYDRHGRSLLVWLGVSYFLTPEAVRAALAGMAAVAAPGSRLVWDHMDPGVVDGTTPFPGPRRAAPIVARRGEPYRFGVDDAGAAALVAGAGFRPVAQVRLGTLGRRYGGPGGVWCRTDDFVGLMCAERVAR